MCRFAGWIGPPRPLSALLYDPSRSLSTQAWDPHEMLYGNVNVDGTGVAWWPGADATDAPPLRYVTPAAAWNDANLPHLAGRLDGRIAIAAVRSATPGIPFGPASVAPFVRDGIALAHNGFIQGFRQGVGRQLLAGLSVDAFNALDAVSDSLVTLLMVRDHVAAGRALPDAIAATIEDIRAALEGTVHGATLNLLASDGTCLVAARASVGLEHNSMYVSTAGGGVTVASEALSTDVVWEKVEPQTVLVARDGAFVERPL